VKDSRYVTVALVTLAVVGISLPLILWCSVESIRGVRNTPTHWVPPSFEQRRQFDWFVRQFNTRDAVIVSWEGCTVDDSRLERFEELVSDADKDGRVSNTLTGYTAVRRLMAEPIGLSRSQATGRLRGVLIGPDRRSSCAVLFLSEFGMQCGESTVEFIIDCAERATELEPAEIRLAGSLVDGVAIDEETRRSLALFALPSAILSLIVCWICLRSSVLTLGILAVSAYGSGLVLTLVQLAGVPLNAILIVLPPLVFVLTVSAGVHLANYFFDEVSHRSETSAAARAMRNGWQPCLLCAVTTAIGLASLAVSNIVPIDHFGLFAAIGVMVTVLLLFLVMPAAMVTWQFLRDKKAAGSRASQSAKATRSGLGAWRWLLIAIGRYPNLIAISFVGAMLLAGVGLGWVHTSVNVRNLLVSDSRTLRDYGWLEAHVGPLVPIEIVVHFDQNCSLDVLQRVETLARVHSSLREFDLFEGAASAATFTPPIPRPSFRTVVPRSVLRSHLLARRAQLIEAHWLSETETGECWRISMRLPALGDVDYGVMLARVRETVDPVLEDEPGVRATYTGLMPLVYEAQHALLADLFKSFLTALGLVTIAMVFVLRRVSAGLVAMIPNMFPAVFMFGVMGWLDVKADIGSVMTASVALGIAVDGTIHFVSWFRRETSKGYSRLEAVARTFRHCGRAMTQTTIICGLGLLVFTLSGFIPTRRFALMMCTLLLAALAGDLILLPALLVGPLGRFFQGRATSASQ
jgi:predicted RND superfamily exporter protein